MAMDAAMDAANSEDWSGIGSDSDSDDDGSFSSSWMDHRESALSGMHPQTPANGQDDGLEASSSGPAE
jgi:hypothetical protein